MNGFHFAHMVSRLARLPRPRRVALSTGLVVLGLVVISLAWLAGSPRRSGPAQPRAVAGHACRLAVVGPGAGPAWPRYLPELPAASASCASIPGARDHDAGRHSRPAGDGYDTALDRGRAGIVCANDSTGRAGNDASPALAAVAGGTPTLPVAGGTPTLASGDASALLASRPAGPVPPPAVAPLPARLPVTRAHALGSHGKDRHAIRPADPPRIRTGQPRGLFCRSGRVHRRTASDRPRIGQRRKHDGPQPGLECRLDGHERGPGLHPRRRESSKANSICRPSLPAIARPC